MPTHNNNDPRNGSGPSLLRFSIILILLSVVSVATLALMIAV